MITIQVDLHKLTLVQIPSSFSKFSDYEENEALGIRNREWGGGFGGAEGAEGDPSLDNLDT